MFVADGPGSRQALAPDIPCCHRCRIRHVELLAGVCDSCYEEQVEALFNPGAEMFIAMPISNFFDEMMSALRLQLKKKPTRLSFTIKPCNLELFMTLRDYWVGMSEVATMPRPTMTKGKRGGTTKQWELVADDTMSFQSLVGFAFERFDVLHSFGSGLLFDGNVCTAWLPPLTMIMTVKTIRGEMKSSFSVKTSSGRLTQYGFDFVPPRSKKVVSDVGPALKRYLALMAFQLQQRRVNAQSDHTSSLSLPAPLLLAAHPHIA